MKRYMDIRRLKQTFEESFRIGDEIVVQEKIDGANFSLKYEKETDSIVSFSRKKELNFSNNLRGAFQWSQNLNVDLIHSVLGDNLILFGEWLVPHTIQYPEDKYQNAYFYDVFDRVTECYLSQVKVEDIVSKLNLNFVPVFYRGKFTSWNDLKQYVGKTELGGKFGEGIVVKNQTRLNNPNNREPFYTKIVCEKFCETKDNKIFSSEELTEKQKLKELTLTVVTEARVRKIINKMVDENIIPINWNECDMSTIAKNLGKEIYCDCVKEESDVVNQVGQYFGKFSNNAAMKIVRTTLLPSK